MKRYSMEEWHTGGVREYEDPQGEWCRFKDVKKDKEIHSKFIASMLETQKVVLDNATYQGSYSTEEWEKILELEKWLGLCDDDATIRDSQKCLNRGRF